MTTRRVKPTGDVSRARVKPPVPPSAAWEVGDPVAGRRFAQIGDLQLEGGKVLPHVIVAYETWGELNDAGDNAVLILHALTGDAHVTDGKAPGQLTAGWWEQMVGPGCPIDTDKYFVVAPNVLGGCSGTTGPASRRIGGRRWAGEFPRLSVRDQVAAEIGLAHHLGIHQWQAVVGASMGGLRALEWALLGPENGIEVRKLIAIATSAATSSDQIAWAHPQLAAIRLDPGFQGGDYYDSYDDAGPHRGLAIARQIAHATYRSADELNQRFQRFPQSGEDPLVDGRYAIQSYLDHHGDKLARRFDANSYIVLTEAMFTHDLGRDRGGTNEALTAITAQTLVVAVDSDRLYPPSQSEHIAALVPDAELVVIHSGHGHDGFLIEFEQLGPAVRSFLALLDPANLPTDDITLIA